MKIDIQTSKFFMHVKFYWENTVIIILQNILSQTKIIATKLMVAQEKDDYNIKYLLEVHNPFKVQEYSTKGNECKQTMLLLLHLVAVHTHRQVALIPVPAMHPHPQVALIPVPILKLNLVSTLYLQ